MAKARKPRVVLLEPDPERRRVLSGRLSAQLFEVEAFGDPSEAANWALGNPPAALIADVWMSGVSGVQLCRLMRSEEATSHVPIILRADGDEPKARFWAEQAGAAAYVPKGRIGDLVRALRGAIAETPESEGFFTQLAHTDVRDRIALHLDRALFESVIASSVRALATSESFDLIFDVFSQFVCRVATYRWLAVSTEEPRRFAVHCHPDLRTEALKEAAEALGVDDCGPPLVIEDEDAADALGSDSVICHDIEFGESSIGKLAMHAVRDDPDAAGMALLVAREIGGPLKIASLVEESRRLARYDPLTGIMNRRAFVEDLEARLRGVSTGASSSLSLILLDVDHFKNINDTHGHAAGDRVLSRMGALMTELAEGGNNAVARWGGEEFVLALANATVASARSFAECIRRKVSEEEVYADSGEQIPLTVSLGVAELSEGEHLESIVERADQAMYAAKVGGRNRVEVAPAGKRPLPPSLALSRAPGQIRISTA